MIRCKKCGTLNAADATFCSQCDAFLEWSGEQAETEGGRESVEASGASPAEVPGAGPGPRKPEKGKTAPVRKAKPQEPSAPERPKPGQYVCATCGTGNDRDRKFCRRCGTAMDRTPVEPLPPPARPRRRSSWFSSVLRRGKQEAYMAGQRPQSMLSSRGRWRPGSSMMVFSLLGIIGLGGLASYLYVPGVSDAVDDVVRTVQNRFVAREEIRPIATAGAARPGYPALNLIDGGSDTYWVGTRNASGRWVVRFDFQRDSDLLQINFDSGASGDQYEKLGRPFKFRLRADDELGPVYELSDTSDQQAIDIDVEGVRSVTLLVLSKFRGTEAGDDIAIREVKFFGSGS